MSERNENRTAGRSSYECASGHISFSSLFFSIALELPIPLAISKAPSVFSLRLLGTSCRHYAKQHIHYFGFSYS